jgi:hypothetical protein
MIAKMPASIVEGLNFTAASGFLPRWLTEGGITVMAVALLQNTAVVDPNHLVVGTSFSSVTTAQKKKKQQKRQILLGCQQSAMLRAPPA